MTTPPATSGTRDAAQPVPAPGGRSTRARARLAVLALVLALIAVAAVVAVWFALRPDPVLVDDFGAVGDGRTDDTAAIQEALDSVQPGQRLEFREGATYRHDGVLVASVAGVELSGGATLSAGDEERSAFRVQADDLVVQDMTFAVPETTRRWDSSDQMRIHVDGHTGLVLRDVTVRGSAAAGIYVGGGASDFLLERVHVEDTRADGIHITQGSSDGTLEEPSTSRTGDDGVAVVSYAQDGAPSERITVASPVVRDAAARGLSVVGGRDVTWTDVDVSGTSAAGIYIAVEGDPYYTTGTSGVRADGGTVADANQDSSIDHGAILVYAGGDEGSVDDVELTGLSVTGTRDSASRQVGLVSSREDAISGITIEDLTVEGGPAQTFTSDVPAGAATLRDWVVDGEEVDDPTP